MKPATYGLLFIAQILFVSAAFARSFTCANDGDGGVKAQHPSDQRSFEVTLEGHYYACRWAHETNPPPVYQRPDGYQCPPDYLVNRSSDLLCVNLHTGYGIWLNPKTGKTYRAPSGCQGNGDLFNC